MLLVIDVGNTDTSLGVYDGPRLVGHFRLTSERGRTAAELTVALDQQLAANGVDKKRLSGAAMASVVPVLGDTFRRVCVDSLDLTPLEVGADTRTGLTIIHDNPREIGADRIVNAVAGYERFRSDPQGPCGVIVVDLGTATTFDVVTPRGDYVGGAIAPGLGIGAEALFQRAARLPRVALERSPAAIGKNTVHSMQAGILLGYAGLVDGLIVRLAAEVDFVPRVIATGGLAGKMQGLASRIEVVDEFLTLEGLRLVYDRNSSGGQS